MVKELKNMVGMDENILYEGKPNKKCFIFESIFNPLLPFALVWAFFDLGILFMAKTGNSDMKEQAAIIPFLLLHMMPVWVYLFGVIFTFKRYRNAYYIVSDHAIYISSGVFTMNFETKTFAELSRVNLHRGIFDQMFKVGDIIITTNQYTQKGRPAEMGIHSISEYSKVFQLIQKLQKDIYSDTMYPNDLRPNSNHGYQTKYRG